MIDTSKDIAVGYEPINATDHVVNSGAHIYGLKGKLRILEAKKENVLRQGTLVYHMGLQTYEVLNERTDVRGSLNIIPLKIIITSQSESPVKNQYGFKSGFGIVHFTEGNMMKLPQSEIAEYELMIAHDSNISRLVREMIVNKELQDGDDIIVKCLKDRIFTDKFDKVHIYPVKRSSFSKSDLIDILTKYDRDQIGDRSDEETRLHVTDWVNKNLSI